MASIADELAKKQKEISVSEFFERNRHILGFDSQIKSLIMGIKEAVDNSWMPARRPGCSRRSWSWWERWTRMSSGDRGG